MKIRSLAAGLAAFLSLVCFAPAMAQQDMDNGSNSQTMQPASPSANTMGSNNAGDMGSANNMDKASPDTATGDDDY